MAQQAQVEAILSIMALFRSSVSRSPASERSQNLDGEIDTFKWNAAVVNVIYHTYAFPAFVRSTLKLLAYTQP